MDLLSLSILTNSENIERSLGSRSNSRISIEITTNGSPGRSAGYVVLSSPFFVAVEGGEHSSSFVENQLTY